MTFALGAACSGYFRADDHMVHFSAGKKGTNRVRQRTLSDVKGSASLLAPTSNLLGRPSAYGHRHGASRTRWRTA